MPSNAFLSHNNHQLHLLQKRLTSMVTLAAEKVTGHLLHPSQYPLPAAGKKSIERALHDVIMELPKRKRDDFTDQFKTLLGTGTVQREKKYGELHAVNLHSAVPVTEQVKNIPSLPVINLTEKDYKELEALIPAAKRKKMGAKRVPRQAVATKLDFIVDSITCKDTTDIRKDEISLGAFATDAAGLSFNKDPFFVSKFKKGETVPLGAKGNLFSFSLDAGSTGGNFPLTFAASIFLNEKDLMSNKELNRKLTIFLSLLGVAIMAAGILVMALVPPAFWLGMAIFLFGGVVYIFGNDVLPLFLLDDFGVPVADVLVLDAPPVPGETIRRTAELPLTLLEGFTAFDYTANIRWVAS
jgi:hypothetical protein